MLKDFNKNFGITSTPDEEQTAFMNRASNFLQELRYRILSQEEYSSLFSTVCIQLGLNTRKLIDDNSFLKRTIPELNEVLPESFLNTLKIISVVRKYYFHRVEMAEVIDENIEGFLGLATLDLGITYKQGVFFPKGEKLLDKELIEYSLSTLQGFPNENKDLQNALDNYRLGTKYGVIENCYRCIEGFCRLKLNNNKTLIDNKVEIIKSIGLSDNWKKILVNYIEYGNEYGRHASS